jgi:hypothetical protein
MSVSKYRDPRTLKTYIESVLSEVFVAEDYEIIYHGSSNYDIFTKNPMKKLCVGLAFDIDFIYVSNLDKCGINGATSLELVEKVAFEMPHMKHIELMDISKLKVCGVELNLACLKILSKGESWYNSLGYKYPDYESDKQYNLSIINKPFVELLEMCETRFGANSMIGHIEKDGESWFPGTKLTDTTREYFTKINEIIVRESESFCEKKPQPKYIWLHFFLNYLFGTNGRPQILKYSNLLTKYIVRTPPGTPPTTPPTTPPKSCIGRLCSVFSRRGGFKKRNLRKSKKRRKKSHRNKSRSNRWDAIIGK